MNSSNSNLVTAFPATLRDDVLALISALPEAAPTSHAFTVSIGSETVEIPYRIYHDPAMIQSERLTRTQNELLACLLTRHHSGFVREDNLKRIIDCNQDWIPPFVVQLVGEYVIEIVRMVRDNMDCLDHGIYRSFLRRNPAFYRLTKDRVLSYWNCYHRAERKMDYAGFQVVKAFDSLIRDAGE